LVLLLVLKEGLIYSTGQPKEANMTQADSAWPDLKFEDWQDTLNTLHLWTQIAGKLKLSYMPRINHSWHSAFYVGARGLVSSGICLGRSKFEINFDFIDHTLTILTTDGGRETFSLQPETVAEFWSHFLSATRRLNISVNFVPRPNERPDAIPFAEDTVHATYDRGSTERFWHVLARVDNLLQKFRSEFSGQSSPVHFFWGSFDLAHSRFSGRRAPEHPGGIPHLPDLVTKEAYSHEVSSCGFWPGNDMYPQAAFYSYCYPEPTGFAEADLGVEGAFYHPQLREFILPYERAVEKPLSSQTILDFFHRGYEAATDLGGWDRACGEESSYLRRLQSQQTCDIG
jgi:hypothetical protein